MFEKYFIVSNLSDAVKLKEKYYDTSKIISGGTDLYLEMERGQHNETRVIIDISRIDGLDSVTMDVNGFIHIGPLATHSGCLKSTIIQEHAKCLFQACSQIGAPQIRNRGTIAGNIATASPANDTITALMVLDAKIELLSEEGRRTVDIKDFFTGVRKTVMDKEDIISDIFFKALDNSQKSSFIKVGLRKAQAISLLNCAIYIEISEKIITQARIALGAVGPTVFRAGEAESFLVGKTPNQEAFITAGKLAAQSANPISDLRASELYRKKMIRVHVEKVLNNALQPQEKFLESPVLLWGKEEHAFTPIGAGTVVLSEETPLEINVNGKEYNITGGFEKNLLDLLRENVLLTGTKEGCGEGECGACTVFMDGIAVLACLIPAPRAHKTKIVTIEGISSGNEVHEIQQSFIDEGAVQCGYCTPGFIMSSVKLLEEKPNPSVEEVKVGISGNLCRCTGYYKIVTAVDKASRKVQDAKI